MKSVAESDNILNTMKSIKGVPDDNLLWLIDELKKIDTQSPLAILNESTMADNNGNRIEF